MTESRHIVLVLAAMTLGAVPAIAQSNHIGPSVLAQQNSYHLGTFGLEIKGSTGALHLVVQQGTLDSLASLAMTLTLDVHEFTATTTSVVPGVVHNVTYFIGPEGELELDLDPPNPGTRLTYLFIDPEARSIHSARNDLDDRTDSVIALEKSTGMGPSSLVGDYHYFMQGMEFSGTQAEAVSEWGTISFDGVGAASFTASRLEIDRFGATTTSASSGSLSYTVANDGAINIDSSPGGVSGDGQVFFAVGAYPTYKWIDMGAGVKVGASYDHHDLVGRYSLHSQTHGISAPQTLPNSTTEYGVVTFEATSATTGTWSLEGVSVQSDAQSVTRTPLSITGTSSLASNGIMTLTEPNGVVEIAFSADGRYFVGRVVEPRTSLIFGMRQAEESRAYGAATPGGGGIAPELGMRTFPTLGNASWRFAITDGLGGAPAGLAIGFRPANGIPLAGGLVWLDPAWLIGTPFLMLGGATGAPGAGAVDFPVAIPNDPGLTGLELYSQAFVLDPAAPGGVAMSNGFEMRMGP